MLSVQNIQGAEVPNLEELRRALGFRSVAELLEFTGSFPIQTAWEEFLEDYLLDNYPSYNLRSLPSLNEVTTTIGANRALGAQFDRYTLPNPDKATWGLKHHVARFVIRAYDRAQATDSPWQGVNEPEFANIADQLRMLLIYMIWQWMAENA